jgi:hypothetical protein
MCIFYTVKTFICVKVVNAYFCQNSRYGNYKVNRKILVVLFYITRSHDRNADCVTPVLLVNFTTCSHLFCKGIKPVIKQLVCII